MNSLVIRLLMTILLAFSIALYSYASGIASELESMFNSMGGSSNFTGPGHFTDQSGGYYTGGSFYARTPVKNIDLMNVQMPAFKAGCGGIDLFTGGFSYISSEQLVKMLKSIGSSAKSYAFQLALQTVTPQIYNTLNELNALAQQVNNTNINSCESAATVVGGMWPKSDASSRLLCQAMGTSSNKFSDWAQARQECGKADDRLANMDKKKSEFKDLLGDEFNLAWKALKKNKFLATDDRLAEFFMSISGTIVSKKVGDNFEKHYYSSLAVHDDWLSSFIEGGKGIKIYSCRDREECLDITETNVTINQNMALKPKVEALLRSIAHKVKTDGKVTTEELTLVNSTVIPIYKILTVQVAFREGSSPINVEQFSEAVAYDLLLRYLEDILDIVSQSIREIRKVQIDDTSIESLKSEIRDTRSRILEKRNGIFQQMHTALSVIERSQAIEQQMHNMFTGIGNKDER
jgi:conjugative transfer pilus assembly protein TraH